MGFGRMSWICGVGPSFRRRPVWLAMPFRFRPTTWAPSVQADGACFFGGKVLGSALVDTGRTE